MADETGATRGMRADALRSRARLLDAAVELIARDGGRGLGTDAPNDSVINVANGQKTPYPAI